MAETFLAPVIEKLITFLADEVKSLKGVHGGVLSLKNELEIIQALLIDAEAKSEKAETSNAVTAWVNQIRVQAELIEGVIDKYRYHLRKFQYEKGFMSSVQKTIRFFKSLKPGHEISSEIERIKKSLSEIKASGQGYGLRPLDQAVPSSVANGGHEDHADPRLGSLFIEEDEIIEIECTKDDLVAKLVTGTSDLLVISLVGEGGIGKTTLAKSVFDDGVVERHFESASLWITVSQQYTLKKILRMMKAKICKGELVAGEADAIEDLIGYLRNYLQTMRYVIVFDDVWEERFWDDIKFALPRNKEGSRIIITTRNGSVANYCKLSPFDHIQYIKHWSLTLAFELFCKKAFRYEFQGRCPDELLELSEQIVSKCQGLPLVIAAVAGILATKEKVIFEWQRVLKDLNAKSKINNELTRVQKILSLSYYDLPHFLRHCFMSFCMFPEDYSISDERLYRLWIAEGFVKAKGEKTMEEVAEENMSELIKRNLVLLDPWEAMGAGNYFIVHDLMRDVILSRVEELRFCQIWDAKESKFKGNGRCVMIPGSGKTSLEKVDGSVVRSLFLSNTEDEQLTESSVVTLFKKLKLLEVLDIESCPMGSLPKEIGNMFCLKYLSLRDTNVESLPKSIGRLQNLYSLDIRDTPTNELPKEINKLKNLRHILAYRYNKKHKTCFDYFLGVRLQEGFGELENLETLTAVDMDVRLGGAAIIKELEKLKKLRWLDIEMTTEFMKALCTTIGKMNCLQRATLSSVDEYSVLDVQDISPPPLQLRDLVLIGQLERLPEWILSLPDLCGLCLCSTKLIDDESIQSLKSLRNLETLHLEYNGYEGEELHFEEGGFAKLKRLIVEKLDNLKAVKIDRGALPVLEYLYIDDCPLLEESPSVQHLRNILYAEANGEMNLYV